MAFQAVACVVFRVRQAVLPFPGQHTATTKLEVVGQDAQRILARGKVLVDFQAQVFQAESFFKNRGLLILSWTTTPSFIRSRRRREIAMHHNLPGRFAEFLGEFAHKALGIGDFGLARGRQHVAPGGSDETPSV